MKNQTIRLLKPIVFLLCLVPAAVLYYRFQTDNLGADPVATITHFTGDWAMYMLLGSLAITPVRRLSSKLGWLVRFRRMIGLFAFFYATLHLATYVFLFSGFDVAAAMASLRQHDLHALKEQWLAVWPGMVDDAIKRRFIQVGLIAWTILLALAVTSPQWIMRKMGGKRWQLLHRAVYVAAGLAIIHYWWLVKRGVTTPWRVTAVLVVVLLARVAWSWKNKRRSIPSRRVPVVEV